MSKVIVVPVDGSEHSGKALQTACEMVAGMRARLHVVHVPQATHEDRALMLGGAAILAHASDEELEQAGREVLAAARAVAVENGCDEIQTELLSGDPAKAIVEEAERVRADMIVMGSRGLSDLAGLVFGSVSHKVMHMAPCTCMAVR